MNVTLVCAPEDLESIMGPYQGLLTGYQYNQGKAYADFQEGDKISQYGLTALIAGGALYGAAKLGFLAKFALFFKKGFKIIIVAVIAIGVAVKNFFGRLVNGKRHDRSE